VEVDKMMLTANDFDSRDLDIANRMGISYDGANKKKKENDTHPPWLRIQTSSSSSRWLTTYNEKQKKPQSEFETSRVRQAIAGFGQLPEGVQNGGYSPIDLFYLASEAGMNGVLTASRDQENKMSRLEEMLDADSLDPKSEKFAVAYMRYNEERRADLVNRPSAVFVPEYAASLLSGIEQGIAAAKTTSMELHEKARANLQADQSRKTFANAGIALEAAVNVDYLGRKVAYLTSRLAAVKDGYAIPAPAEAKPVLSMSAN